MLVEYACDDHVATLTLNRPEKLNAFSDELVMALQDALRRFDADPEAFVAIILGGLGSVPGALVGGLLLGVLQSLSAAYLPALLVDAVIFLLLFVILMVRPNGLFVQSMPESPTRRV